MTTTSTIVFNLRVPENLDDIVEEIAGLEFRTKSAVISLALTEYANRHHAGLMKTQTTTKPTGKEVAK